MTPVLKKRTLDDLIYAKGGFGRIRDDYMFLCRKLKLKRPVQAGAILDTYVRFSESRENPVALKFSEAELEKLVRCKTRTIREARRELIQHELLSKAGEDGKGVLICKANLDKIDLETADWTFGWEANPAYAPVKAKPRGRSAVPTGPAIRDAGDGGRSAVASEEVIAVQQDTASDHGKSAGVETAEPNNTWEQVKGRMAGELGPVAIHNWLADTSFASLEDGTLTVEVPSPTAAAWIEQEYGPQIAASLRELSPDTKAVHYRVKSAVVVPGQFWRSAGAEQAPFQPNSTDPSLEEKIPEEKLASQLTELTQSHKPDEQTVRNLNRVFGQLAPPLRSEALGQYAQKIAGYGKRTNIGGGILFNDAKAVCAAVVREHQPFYYFEFATLEQATAQMAADEEEATKHPDRAELLRKRPWMPQPIPFPRGTPQFLAEFERLFRTIPRKFMGREQSARGGLSMAASQ